MGKRRRVTRNSYLCTDLVLVFCSRREYERCSAPRETFFKDSQTRSHFAHRQYRVHPEDPVQCFHACCCLIGSSVFSGLLDSFGTQHRERKLPSTKSLLY